VGKNRDKKIVTVKLIQKKNPTIKATRFRNNIKFSLWVKVLELFLGCPVLVLV
jgi:hypothetical protein